MSKTKNIIKSKNPRTFGVSEVTFLPVHRSHRASVAAVADAWLLIAMLWGLGLLFQALKTEYGAGVHDIPGPSCCPTTYA